MEGLPRPELLERHPFLPSRPGRFRDRRRHARGEGPLRARRHDPVQHGRESEDRPCLRSQHGRTEPRPLRGTGSPRRFDRSGGHRQSASHRHRPWNGHRPQAPPEPPHRLLRPEVVPRRSPAQPLDSSGTPGQFRRSEALRRGPGLRQDRRVRHCGSRGRHAVGRRGRGVRPDLRQRELPGRVRRTRRTPARRDAQPSERPALRVRPLRAQRQGRRRGERHRPAGSFLTQPGTRRSGDRTPDPLRRESDLVQRRILLRELPRVRRHGSPELGPRQSGRRQHGQPAAVSDVLRLLAVLRHLRALPGLRDGAVRERQRRPARLLADEGAHVHADDAGHVDPRPHALARRPGQRLLRDRRSKGPWTRSSRSRTSSSPSRACWGSMSRSPARTLPPSRPR